MNGAELIYQERNRQLLVEGWDSEHDDKHIGTELAEAAACYLSAAIYGYGSRAPVRWPWDAEWWKPNGGQIRNLVKAGALIAAEIDRLQRKESQDGKAAETSRMEGV